MKVESHSPNTPPITQKNEKISQKRFYKTNDKINFNFDTLKPNSNSASELPEHPPKRKIAAVTCPTSFYVALTLFTVVGFAIDHFGITDYITSQI